MLLRATTSSTSSSSIPMGAPIFPRAAVSVCVAHRGQDQDHYLLVQRGNEPNKGMWSLPGGKLEFGEGTIDGGLRELSEETTIDRDQIQVANRTIMTTDSIGESFHYVIAHVYAEFVASAIEPPSIEAADDAAAASWFLESDIRKMEESGTATPGVTAVIEQIETLRSVNVLN